MKTTNLPHLAARIFDTPLLIQQQKLEVILGVLGPRIGLSPTEAEVRVGDRSISTRLGVAVMPMDDMDEDETEDSTDGRAYRITPDGIAVISIQGTLVKKAGWLDAMSGMASYEDIRKQCQDACNDNRIRGILLDIDSPGGEVGGLFDLCDFIHSQRGTKPIYAIADDDAFSAAYALASSAEKVYVTRTGGCGSVGVIALHVDQSGWDQKVGLKYTYVSAGERKTDLNPHEPISDEARGMLQAEIDRLYGMFCDTVARNRDMKASAVQATEAGLYFGPNAVTVGLANAVGTFEDALAAVTAAADSRTQAQPMPGNMPMPMPGMKAESSTGEESPETVVVPDAAAVAAAPNSDEKEATMADTTQAAAQPTASAPLNPPAQPQAAAIDTDEILALCKIAGKKHLFADFVEQKLSVPEVREKLAALAVEQSGTEIRTQHSGVTDASAETQLAAAAANVQAARPTLTKEQAAAEALRANPALYDQYLAAHPAQTKSLGQ